MVADRGTEAVSDLLDAAKPRPVPSRRQRVTPEGRHLGHGGGFYRDARRSEHRPDESALAAT